MTPTRAKRNSKVPNRFSSDNSRIETSNANGETIIDYNDKTTSTTHNLVPMTKAIKFKPVIREPLKVKLPKLKRLQQQQQTTTKDHSVNNSINDIKIHKIKLPSLSSKRPKFTSSETDLKSKVSPVVLNDASITEPKQSTTTGNINSHSKSLLAKATPHSTTATVKSNQINKSNVNISSTTPLCNNIINDTSSKLDISTSSRSFSELDCSFSAETSTRTDDSSSKMEIIVTKSENPNGNDSGIRCPCGVNSDLGVMVECETCSTWQHGHCINVGTEDEAEAYEGYKCAFCTLPPEKVRQSLTQLTVDDKLQARFNILENLRKQSDSSNSVAHLSSNENKVHFTLEELTQAIKDLKRVLGSLRVKWGLLSNEGANEFEMTRIWQNPYWSEDPERNKELDGTVYIGDRCRVNLKLNIRNMIEKLGTRCHLIKCALAQNCSLSYNWSQEDVRVSQTIKQSAELIDNEVKDFKNKLKNLSGSIH